MEEYYLKFHQTMRLKKAYNFTLVATDGENSTTQDVTINVVDVNDNAPVFKTTALSVNENEVEVGAVKATDVDTGSSGAFKSNPLKYSVSGSTFTIAENAGVLKFVSAPDYENDQQRSYTATVTATDGTFSTSQMLLLLLLMLMIMLQSSKQLVVQLWRIQLEYVKLKQQM